MGGLWLCWRSGNPRYSLQGQYVRTAIQFDTNAGTATSIADLSAYELANNPDGGDVVSNYALAIKDDTACR